MGTIPSQYTTTAPDVANQPPVWKRERVIEGRRFTEWYAQGVTWRDYPRVCAMLAVAAANLDDRYPFKTRRDAEKGYVRKHGAVLAQQAVYFYTSVTQHHRRLAVRQPAFAVSVIGDRVELALPNQKRTRWVPLARVQAQEATA